MAIRSKYDNYRICTRCVMDTSDPEIKFDEDGVCNHCRGAERFLADIAKKRAEFDFEKYASAIREQNKSKKYDCVVGISGGVDSCYCVYLAKKYGLRPLAVHFDNGWNSEIATHNIKHILEQLDVDLYTYVLNWQDFRDLQLAFLKASTPDSEIPTDHLIFPILGMVAHKYGVKEIWNGCNQTSESILPRAWSQGHRDWKYIKSIYSQYGTRTLKTYPHFNRMDFLYFNNVFHFFNVLDYIEYDKEKAKAFMISEYGWQEYGGKHFESFYTKFYQSYILPVKFGYDKRRAHDASLIISGQMNREEAISHLECSPFDEKTISRDIDYFCEKMEISRDEFEQIMNEEPKTYWDYPNYQSDFIGKLQKFAYEYKINKWGAE